MRVTEVDKIADPSVLTRAEALPDKPIRSVSFYRGNPEIRDTPLARFKHGLIAIALPVAAFAVLAWALGEWNGAYLTGGATFGAVLFVSYCVWPLLRARRGPRKLG